MTLEAVHRHHREDRGNEPFPRFALTCTGCIQQDTWRKITNEIYSLTIVNISPSICPQEPKDYPPLTISDKLRNSYHDISILRVSD